jgi:hypothetical protein
MDIVRLVEKKILLVAEKIIAVLGEGTSYTNFEMELKKELDGLGCEILGTVLEALEEKTFGSEDRKRDWTVVRKGDPKQILTPFGPLLFKRRYYRNRLSGKHAYLVDQKVGITPHMHVGVNLKASLTETSGENSYEVTTQQISRYNPELKISKQTVGNCVKEFRVRADLGPKKKKSVGELFIEADEDHIKIRGRKGAQARLIYVHEGVSMHPRRHLKNARYFTTVKKTPEAFWLEVCDYIATHYDLSSISSIYLSGDGAKWIQVGREYIPGAIFVLDKFHLSKYILRATAHAPALKASIYQAIYRLDKPAVLARFNEALALADNPARKKRIQDTIRYIKNNWDGIESQVKYPHVSCSAEGHVSHVLSARLSSRPMAWSLKGASNMASIRAVKANGERVREHYMASSGALPALELSQEVKRELIKVKRKLLGKGNVNNIPLFNGGHNLTRNALKGLMEQRVI